MKKRLLSALLALCLVVGMVPTTLLTANAAATPTEVSSVTLDLGADYQTLYGSGIIAGTPALKQAGLTVSDPGVSVSGLTTGNAVTSDTGKTSYSGGSTYQAGKQPYMKVTFRAATGYKFAAKDNLTINAPSGWNTVDETLTSSGSSCSVTMVYDTLGTNLDPLDQTVGFTREGTGAGITGTHSVTIAVGQTWTWKPYSTYTNYAGVITASTAAFEYPTTNNKVATATATGIRGVGKGSCTITLTAKAVNGLLNKGEMTINVEVVDASKLAITGDSSVNWTVGGAAPLALGVTPSGNGTPGSYTWKSSHPEVLTFDAPTVTATTNNAKAVSVGTSTVTVEAWSEDNGTGALLGTATKVITVKPLEVLTPKAGTRTVPFEDASAVITDYTQLTRFFDALTHLAPSTATEVAEGEYYTLSGKPTSSASTYQITATLIDPDNTVWEGSTSSAPKVFTFKVTAKPISDINTAKPELIGNFEYTGELADPEVILKDSAGDTLVKNQDYTITCSEIFVKNDALVTITGINNYTGTKNLYFNIIAKNDSDALTVNDQLFATKGQTIDLREAILSKYTDIDVTKLAGLTFKLDDDDKTAGKATLSDHTLKLANTLGQGETVTVTVSLAETTYNVGGSVAPEYTGLKIVETPITVTVTNAIKKVPIPTPSIGLVYNSKSQVGVADGVHYNLTDGTAPTGKATNANMPGDKTDDYTTVVSLDATSVTDGTKLVWADGTTEDKTLTWYIARARITGDISFTEIKADGYTLANASLIGYFYGADGKLLDMVTNTPADNNEAKLAWVAGDSTYVVQNASYGWELIPYGWSDTLADNASNYEKVTGSAILYGQRAGSTIDQEQENPTQDITTSTITNPDGSTTTITNNKKTGVVTHVTTASNGTSSELTYTKGALTAASATSTAANAVAYVPMSGVSWGSVITINGAVRMDAGLPAEGLDGMWVVLPAGTVSLGLRNQAASFTDVRTNEWFYKAVMLASSRNLIQGIGSNSYGPAGTLNFGQVWSMLARYTGDVTLAQSTGNNWYVQPQNWAYRNNISSGVSYNANATREDVALMMYRTYALENGTPTNVNTSYLSSMSDYGSVSSAARTAVAWAIQNGIIQGYPNGTFQPYNSIRRDEAAQMMARFVYVMEGVNVPSDFMS